MSLLLDALKEAQKQRQSDHDTVPGEREPLDDSGEADLDFELELDLDDVVELDSDGSSSSSDSIEDQNPVISEASLGHDNQIGSVNKDVVKPALDASASAQQESVPPPVSPEAHVTSGHSAKAVFRNRARNKTRRYLFLGLILACLVLLVVGAYLFFMTESFSPPRQVRTSIIDPPVETSTPLPIVDQASPPGSLTSKPIIETETKPTKAGDGVAKNSEIVADGIELAPLVSDAAITTPIPLSPLDDRAHQSQTRTYDEQKTADKVADAGSVEESFVGIKIHKRRIPANRKISLRRAKNAMFNGDLAGAAKNYGAALKAAPTDIEALLGMASVSAIKGQHDQAQFYYQEVLAQSPQNINARAGLLSLADTSSLEVGSALQQLLRESPEQAFLHASLGDYHLKRGEWSAAQRAYFDAFSRAPKNANYAYNLAVSLDQMGKPKLALQFYQTALILEKSAMAHFDSSVLAARIAFLKAEL